MKPHITLVALYPVNSSTVIIVILMKTCHTLLSQFSIHLAISSLLDFAKCGFFLLFLVGCNKSKLWLDMIFASEAKQNVSAYRLMTLWSMYYSSAVYKPFLCQHSLLHIANSIFLHVSIACSLTRRSSEFCWLLIWCFKYCNDDTTDEDDSRVTQADKIVDA